MLEILELLIEAWLSGDPNVDRATIDEMAFFLGGFLTDPALFRDEIEASMARSDALIVLVSNNSEYFSDEAFAQIATTALAQSSTNPNHQRRVSYPGALQSLIAKAAATPSRRQSFTEHLAASPEAIRGLVTNRDLD
ncbi:hypothetical protein V6O07_06885, partial [Arthrospira platensis SPKY2]